MKIEQLRLQAVDDDAAWDALVARSPQGTVFARSAYLQALGLPNERLALPAGQRVAALLPLVHSADGRTMQWPPYTPHLGLVFVPDPQAPRSKTSTPRSHAACRKSTSWA